MIWRIGTGPFVTGFESVDGRALLAAAAIGFVTTVCGAWRWTIVARGLGLRMSLPAAVAAYYRALFLNLTLPTGIAGDVHRGVSHGREVHHVGRAVRAVVWERGAGQVVQAVLMISILLVLPSPVHSVMPFVALAAVGLAAVAVLGGRMRLGRVDSRWMRAAERRGGRPPQRSAAPERVARDRACLDRGRPRLRAHVSRRCADGRRHGSDLTAPAGGAARDTGNGAAEHRRLGAEGGSGRLGLLRSRPRARLRAPRPPSHTASSSSPRSCPARSCSSPGGFPARRVSRARPRSRAVLRPKGAADA